MKFAAIAAGLVLLAASPAFAAPALSSTMQPLGFLLGRWTAAGQAHGGQTAKGSFVIEPVAGGAGLLRRDRTELSGGSESGSFEQVMLIYPEGAGLHGDYFDGTHVIHYVSAKVDPGKSVVFESADVQGPPRFRLTYAGAGQDRLAVTFEMRPPGGTAYQTIASGEAKRD